MKTILILLLLCFCDIGYTANTINIEYETENIKTYVINNQGYSCFNSFIKYNNTIPEYWFRVNLKFRDRLMPTASIIIDGQTYKLYAVEEYKKRHLKAGTGTEIDGNYNYQDFECYIIPSNIIKELTSCQSSTLFINSLKKKNMQINLNQEFIANMKQVINM